MSKRTITLICIVLPIALVGLLILQTQWIYVAINLRQEQFGQTVNKCTDNVISRLETDELMASRFDNIHEQPTDDISRFGHTTATEIDTTFSETTINFKIDNLGLYRTEIVRDGMLLSTDIGHANLRKPFGDDAAANVQQTLCNVLHQRIRYLEVKQSKSLFEDRPIELRINPIRIDALFKQQFDENGITEPYEFAVYSSTGKTVFSTPMFREANAVNVYERKLFPNDLHAKTHFVRLYFAQQPQLTKDIVGLIVPTCVFMLLVIGLSVYTLIIIQHQKRLDQIKNDFIGNMTHEFKTPISTISLAAQMTSDLADVIKPDSIRSKAQIIISEGKRLTSQVEKILQIASFDSGKAQLRLVKKDINEVVENVVNTFRIQIENAGGEIGGAPPRPWRRPPRGRRRSFPPADRGPRRGEPPSPR